MRHAILRAGRCSASRSAAFAGPWLSSDPRFHAKMAARRTALLVYRSRGGGNDAHHPTVFCYTNIEPRASRSWDRRGGPDGPRPDVRARGREDLISSAIGRDLPPPHHRPRSLHGESPPPSNPPLSVPSPPSSSRRLCASFLICSSSSSTPLSSLVVHELFSSRAEFIPPAKYPRVRLPISPPSSPFRLSPPPDRRSFRVRARFFFLSLIIYSDSFIL